ncbi:MAG: NFACT RNA binding domain-containing protein [Halobacteriales archaeon]|nr:NFACT RNA binding domain-containing protein [Halobacteriales archaeon]
MPFTMLRYPAPRFAHQEASSFRDALDELFVGTAEQEGEAESAEEDPRRAPFEEAKGRLLRQVAQVEGAIVGFRREEAEARQDAEALYASFPLAQSLLEGLTKARRDRSWAQVEETLAAGRAEGNPLALQVPELRAHNGTALLRLAGPDGTPRAVEVDLRLSVQENADARYAEAKRAKARREGADVAIADARAKLEVLEKKGLDAFGTAPARAERVSRHFWFESYRWTLTPGGLLAVGGRSAAQNDAVVKKYLRVGDRYVHAEIHGAPSVVVRPAEAPAGDISTEDLRTAAHFAVVSSRAWRQFGPATAYWVTPEQVSKTPRSGEYVPRGAWMIHGKRNVEPDLPMEWWVGKVRFLLTGVPVPHAEWDAHPRTVEKLAGAALATLRRYAAGCVKLVPGAMDPNDAAQQLAAIFGVSNEEAMSVLPAGSVQILAEPSMPLEAKGA